MKILDVVNNIVVLKDITSHKALENAYLVYEKDESLIFLSLNVIKTVGKKIRIPTIRPYRENDDFYNGAVIFKESILKYYNILPPFESLNFDAGISTNAIFIVFNNEDREYLSRRPVFFTVEEYRAGTLKRDIMRIERLEDSEEFDDFFSEKDYFLISHKMLQYCLNNIMMIKEDYDDSSMSMHKKVLDRFHNVKEKDIEQVEHRLVFEPQYEESFFGNVITIEESFGYKKRLVPGFITFYKGDYLPRRVFEEIIDLILNQGDMKKRRSLII